MLRSALATLALLLLTTTGAWAEPAPPEAVAAIQRVAASLGLPGTPYLVLTIDKVRHAVPGHLEFVDGRVAVAHTDPGYDAGAFVAWILWARVRDFPLYLPDGDWTNYSLPRSAEHGATFVGWTKVSARCLTPFGFPSPFPCP